MAVLLATRRMRLGMAVGAATALALLTFVQIAHERVEALFSWRPFAQTIVRTTPPGAHVFFVASNEYQLCGGLAYYVGRRLDLLAPPGWVPPTFLEGRTDRLFTPRSELRRRWRSDQALLVADDVPAAEGESTIAPGPYSLVARAGDRVLLRPRASPREDDSARGNGS
jgi:hypothetical protein